MGRWLVPFLRFASIAVPLMGNALAVCAWLPLAAAPPGAVVRPMILSALAILVALAAFGLGVPVGVASIACGNRVRGCLCIGFSLTPFPLSEAPANLLTSLKHLTWAD